MDKKITIIIIAVIMAVVAIGAFLGFANTFIPESSELTDLFDYSIQPTTNWNPEKGEYSFNQSISSVDGKDYRNIDINVNFYKDKADSILISQKNYLKNQMHFIMM